MDFGRSFTFMTEDPQWINKLLIAGVMTLAGVILLPVLIGIIPLLILGGYMIELLQNTASGMAQPLPEWNEFGAKLFKGLNAFAIGIVYALPLLLFACCNVALNILAGGSSSSTSTTTTPNSTLSGIVTIVGLCFGCFSTLYGILLAVIVPAATTMYAVKNELAAAFRISEVIAYIRSNLNSYIIAVLMAAVAGFIAGFGFIACVIGLFFTIPWSQMVQYYLYGEVYRQSQGAAPPAATAYSPPAPAM